MNVSRQCTPSAGAHRSRTNGLFTRGGLAIGRAQVALTSALQSLGLSAAAELLEVGRPSAPLRAAPHRQELIGVVGGRIMDAHH